jgi:uncharacterized protein YndB with AHSA1/START domain
MNTIPSTAYVEPLRKTIRVQATPQRAFEVFTAGMGRWWIPEHSINPSRSPQVAVVMEPRVGGRWHERNADGSECDWGRVLAWEPPHRVVLAWQISAQWTFDPALLTEVEVRFAAVGDGATEVTLEHRKLEAFGESAAAMRKVFESAGGWQTLLERFAAAM